MTKVHEPIPLVLAMEQATDSWRKANVGYWVGAMRSLLRKKLKCGKRRLRVLILIAWIDGFARMDVCHGDAQRIKRNVVGVVL